MRRHFWRQYIGEAKTLPPILYGLHHSRPSQEKDDEQEVLYTTALEPQHLPENVEGQPIVLQHGEYAMFHYQGTPEHLQEFILTLYSTCLPTLKLTRRKGQDIERFYTNGRAPGTTPTELQCDYLIPIRRSRLPALALQLV